MNNIQYMCKNSTYPKKIEGNKKFKNILSNSLDMYYFLI